ncbi:MAG TPA: outer membrane lipoprotein carrier protein LolA [Crocinitomicaceae bacterium]|nr:outer membrane lipoprotein carrier protein LolA [Crocinitomicaceae bacterium]
MKILFTLLTLLSFSAISFSQVSSQSVLDRLSKKMKTHKSFYIEFSSTTKNSTAGTNTTDTGKGWVKNNKFYASFGDNTIISNGLKTWMIVKEEKSVYVSDADEEEDVMNPRKLMTIWEDGFKNKMGKETTINGEKMHVIYLYPKNPGSVEYHTIILYISKAKEDLKKVIIKTKDATVMTYRLKVYKPNPTIADSKFVFSSKKYPGYTVIED